MISMSVLQALPQHHDPDLTAPRVVVGVDTHQRTHHAAVIDTAGRLLGDQEFPASTQGYAALLGWVSAHGVVTAVGVESTGSYGAGLTRHLVLAGVEVFEVAGPDKHTRTRRGKSDPIDAESAARQVLNGTAVGRPKVTTGVVEAIRALVIPRRSAVKDRTRAYAQMRDLATTAPGLIHDELIELSPKQRAAKAVTYRPDLSRLEDPLQATKHALRTLARRIHALDEEIAIADRALDKLVAATVPSLVAMPQVGTHTAAQLLITAGENLERMRSEASFAKLTGTAPIPASSGKTNRHRLDHGGDRAANSALHMIVVGRLKNHPETKTYVQRRESEGKSRRDAIRSLKRYLARHIYNTLKTDLLTA